MSKATLVDDITLESEAFMPEPFAQWLGAFERRRLADHFGLDKIGVHLETLPPGSRSALHHWHTASDELIYVLEGELVSVTDNGESVLKPGMCIGFKAGRSVGHHLSNRSDKLARFLAIGSRNADDRVQYPNDDLQWLQDEAGNWYPARKDGSRIPFEPASGP